MMDVLLGVNIGIGLTIGLICIIAGDIPDRWKENIRLE
jgi:hypothetical protein